MCLNDGWVMFRNSELLSGNLGKKVLGGAKRPVLELYQINSFRNDFFSFFFFYLHSYNKYHK